MPQRLKNPSRGCAWRLFGRGDWHWRVAPADSCGVIGWVEGAGGVRMGRRCAAAASPSSCLAKPCSCVTAGVQTVSSRRKSGPTALRVDSLTGAHTGRPQCDILARSVPAPQAGLMTDGTSAMGLHNCWPPSPCSTIRALRDAGPYAGHRYVSERIDRERCRALAPPRSTHLVPHHSARARSDRSGAR